MMPKPKRPRPDLVERLCDAVEHLTAERAARSYGIQWIMVTSVARHLGITDELALQAVALAVQRHRLQTDGSVPPHSVALDRACARAERRGGRWGNQWGNAKAEP
jgi:hypothetical protein